FAPGQLSRIADTVSAALDTMTGATAPRLHLELMIARALVGAPQARGEGAAPAQGSPAGHTSAQAAGPSPSGPATAPPPRQPGPASAGPARPAAPAQPANSSVPA